MLPPRGTAGSCDAALAGGGAATVEHHRTGRHDDASPGASGPPAEVGVDPPVCELGTEPAEPVPQVTSDEHARRRHRENVDPTVQLALIDLTGGDA